MLISFLIAAIEPVAVITALTALVLGLLAALDSRRRARADATKARAEASKVDADAKKTTAEAQSLVILSIQSDVSRLHNDVAVLRRELDYEREWVRVLEAVMREKGISLPPRPAFEPYVYNM